MKYYRDLRNTLSFFQKVYDILADTLLITENNIDNKMNIVYIVSEPINI